MSILLAFLLGALPGAIALLSGRVIFLPTAKKVESMYPVIYVSMRVAAERTGRDPYVFLLDATVQAWLLESLSQEDAALLVAASLKYFNRKDFLDSDRANTYPVTVERGTYLASILVDRFEKLHTTA